MVRHFVRHPVCVCVYRLENVFAWHVITSEVKYTEDAKYYNRKVAHPCILLYTIYNPSKTVTTKTTLYSIHTI